MAKSINKYKIQAEYKADYKNLPTISLSYIEGSDVCKSVYIPDYFYIESLEDGNIFTKLSLGIIHRNVYYSKDKELWSVLSSISSITINANERIYLKGDGTDILSKIRGENIPLFDTTKLFNVGGSLKTTFSPNNDLQRHAFYSILNKTKVVDASKLTLPSKMPQSCCQSMFDGCASLTAAPALPATELGYNCYAYMFKDCASLKHAPELPATTLVNGCYTEMFRGCSKLNNVTCLATNISASYTRKWLSGVASSGTFTKAASITGWSSGESGIPIGWEVKDYEG
jgi:hypothetical protein